MERWVARSKSLSGERLAYVDTPCPICNKLMKQPCCDEDPVTGMRRGWLCHSCNLGIGKFYDDPTLLIAAAQYLTGSSSTTSETNTLW